MVNSKVAYCEISSPASRRLPAPITHRFLRPFPPPPPQLVKSATSNRTFSRNKTDQELFKTFRFQLTNIWERNSSQFNFLGRLKGSVNTFRAKREQRKEDRKSKGIQNQEQMTEPGTWCQ